MTAPASIPALIAEGRRLIAEATPGPLRAAGGYLTARDPEGPSFTRSIYHLKELGHEHSGGPFQAVPFARPADAAKLAFAWNALPALLDVAEAGGRLQRAYSPDGVTAEKLPSWDALDSALSKLRGVRT